MALTIEEIFESASPNTLYFNDPNHPPTCTLWYDVRDGIICGVSDGKPLELRGNNCVVPISLLWDNKGPLPKINPKKPVERTGMVEKVLRSITEYRKSLSN